MRLLRRRMLPVKLLRGTLTWVSARWRRVSRSRGRRTAIRLLRATVGLLVVIRLLKRLLGRLLAILLLRWKLLVLIILRRWLAIRRRRWRSTTVRIRRLLAVPAILRLRLLVLSIRRLRGRRLWTVRCRRRLAVQPGLLVVAHYGRRCINASRGKRRRCAGELFASSLLRATFVD